ncbi:hypothetical protein [Microvirga mediterraneensis]|uniref:Uncharacterized protein n=1 Tax=Microvirga mediterraneensis TaxID=2754695 RepID=A0A838BSF8_9HYPH|nr:hypothetical protein [Microvirga mediterraneensis]MBA1157833.1 hypothetical protein [Microvirga mediterraneensis]
MTFDGSHLTSRRTEIASDRAPRRLGIPLIPALLSALAILNVVSVVMALMD